jgi:ribosomal-protein-serine acetyltransferase
MVYTSTVVSTIRSRSVILSQNTRKPIILTTSNPDVELRELKEADADAFFDVVQQNRTWLTRYGDYQDLIKMTSKDIAVEFSNKDEKGPFRMGIWHDNKLVGRVDISPVAPETYNLGYWISEGYSRRGYVTSSCRAIMDYVSLNRTVREYWAGIRNVNFESIAILENLGFSLYEQLPERRRYRLLPH